MSTLIKTYEGDVGYDLNFTLQDSAGAAVDITGSTLKLKAQRIGAAALDIDASMAIVSGTAGTCKYTVASGQLATAGDYYAEIEVTFAGGKIVTYGDFVIRVLKQLPR